MNPPLSKLAVAILFGLAATHCGSDGAVRGQRCSTDGDCPSGSVCQIGRCTEVTGPGVGGDSDAGAGDVPSPDAADATPDGGGDDVRLPDGGGEDAGVDIVEDVQPGDDGETNACGGSEALEGEPGDECGECLDGELACDGTDALMCDGASEPNLCGGCGPLENLPGLPCGDCADGLWRCVETELVCDCDVVDPDGTCANPFPIELGDVVQVDLCDMGDDIAPQDNGEGGDCETIDVQGQDVVYTLTLEAAQTVEIDLRDDDPNVGIDTVVYVRTTCADDDNQVACDDDVPCEESDITTGACTGEVQVRQSTLVADLEAGTYFLVADSFTYNQFTCGTVRLEILGGE